MTTLPHAISGVADALEVPVARVNTRGQKLRENRLVPVTGRGITASHLDARHVVRILLAAIIPDIKLADVVAYVKRLEAMPISHWAAEPKRGSGEPPVHLLSKDTLVEVIEEPSGSPPALEQAPKPMHVDKAFSALGPIRTLGDALVAAIESRREDAPTMVEQFQWLSFALHINGENFRATVSAQPQEGNGDWSSMTIDFQAPNNKRPKNPKPITTSLTVRLDVFEGLAHMLDDPPGDDPA